MSDTLQQVIASVQKLNQKKLQAVQEFIWKLNGLEDALGSLAMRFRNTRDDAERQQVAKEYAEVVDKLIATKQWNECPAPEDQLPNEYMPKAFGDYWWRELPGLPG